MKILKIELQNINSLRSSKPIVIDFEGDKFKDIGLFAITGPTGAGKTTILDSIMIALFHKIPRLSGSYLGTTALEMAISYGAPKAFVTLDFENEGVRYQAHWDVIRESKNGKKINPKHNYSFKNLSTKEILASVKKTEVYEAIQKVILLSDKQFLRSVLLAQGEFKAFLKADRKDKGELLEQITGEEIYKKIGSETLKRVGEEREKLHEIALKINIEDLISSEELLAFKEEENELNRKDQEREIVLLDLGKSFSWYKKEKENRTDLVGLEIEQLAHESVLQESAPELERLDENNKAEPFRNLIKESKQFTSDFTVKTANVVELNTNLLLVDEKLTEESKLWANAKEAEDLAEKDFIKWQPILQELVDIESSISVSDKSKSDKEKQLIQLDAQTERLSATLKAKTDQKSLLIESQNLIQNYLAEKKTIPEVEKNYADWKTQLTQRKNKQETLNKEKLKLNDSKLRISNSQEKLKIEVKNHAIALEEFTPLEEKLNQLEKTSSENDLAILLEKKDSKETEIELWKQVSVVSNDYKKYNDELTSLRESLSSLLASEQNLIETIESLESRKEVESEFLEKAKTILKQQQLIQRYEEDRKHLEKGEPCNLCGSTEHPYVDEYKTPESSEAEEDLKIKEQQLSITVAEISASKQKGAVLNNELESLKSNIEKGDGLLTELEEESQSLQTTSSVSAIEDIKNKLSELSNEKDKIDQAIHLSSSQQKVKEETAGQLNRLKDLSQIQQNEIIKLETLINTLNESEADLSKAIDQLLNEIVVEESRIKKSFDLFKLELPPIENTEILLTKIQNKITNYNTEKEKGQKIEEQIGNNEIEIKSCFTQIEEIKEFKINLREGLDLVCIAIEQQTEKRNSLLPIDTSVAEKRETIQLTKAKASAVSSRIEKDILSLREQKTVLNTECLSYDKQLNELSLKIVNLKNQTEELLSASKFDSLSEIVAVLLNPETKQAIEQLQEKLTHKTVQLNTLGNQFTKETEKLKVEKLELKIEDSEEAITNKNIELQEEQKLSLSRLGEINEKFRRDKEIRTKNETLVSLKDAQQKELDKWLRLYSLLGNSETAFNTYVQRVTLKRLLHLANIHLFKLNNRYSLYMSHEIVGRNDLDFTMIDHYHSDEARAIDTASGGEEFLISLALALGLADLTSNNMSIDSLFIDEGFGTLDPDSLESAMYTLETLQAGGKLIGIISHVENLKERIPTQIQVSKKNNGVSTVSIVSNE